MWQVLQAQTAFCNATNSIKALKETLIVVITTFVYLPGLAQENCLFKSLTTKLQPQCSVKLSELFSLLHDQTLVNFN